MRNNKTAKSKKNEFSEEFMGEFGLNSRGEKIFEGIGEKKESNIRVGDNQTPN